VIPDRAVGRDYRNVLIREHRRLLYGHGWFRPLVLAVSSVPTLIDLGGAFSDTSRTYLWVSLGLNGS
jgi:hypothetical protein